MEQLGVADDLVERRRAQVRQQLAHLRCDLGHEMHDHLRLAGELGAQVLALRRDADRAGVVVTRAGHLAARGHERGRAEAEFVRTEQRSDDHVAARLEAAVHPDAHPAAQAVDQERLLRLGQAHLPRRARVLDRAERRRAGAAVVAAQVDEVRVALGDARRDGAHACLRDELDGDGRLRVGLLQVEDELCQVLDAVDVVVGRRGDECDARRRVADARNLRGDLVPRQLAAFARLGALRHFDLQFVRGYQVGRGHAEAAGRHLLNPAVALGAVPLRAFAALAAVAGGAEPVHRDSQRLVRLRAERAVRHGRGGEAAHDGLNGLDLRERNGRATLRVERQQIADFERCAALHEPGIVPVCGGQSAVARRAFVLRLPA